ncbi:MAG TPA: D-alanyl-D-alanine carboxypeptidase [Clostridiales bacterium]|nr:D-alanyl-D-alanine carboxypeptidase [Clostridiales bacterium]
MKKSVFKFICYILITIILISSAPAIVFGEPADKTATGIDISVVTEQENSDPLEQMTAQGAVIIELNTGKVLFGKQEYQRLYPASTTKILTALIAAEYGKLDEMVTVGDEVNLVPWDSSKAGLTIGEKITLRDLVLGMMINSGNDAANTIAVHIARKKSGKNLSTQEALDYFAMLMNDRAKKAGARNSHFVNPHGYHDPDHYTTAYDLAMIGREAMKNEFFMQAASTISMDTKYWDTGEPRYWRSKNKILNKNEDEYYEYATGGKTGYTSKAGQCLVTFASKNGLDLVAVVLNSQHNCQWKETRDMLEYGFSNFEYHVVFREGAIIQALPVDNYASDDWGSLAVQISAKDFGDVFHREDIPLIKQEIIWNTDLLSEKSTEEMPRLEAPIYKGQQLGVLNVTLNGKLLASAPLTAVRDVQRKTVLDVLTPEPGEPGFSWIILVVSIISAFILLKIAVLIINRRRRRRYFMYRRY